MADVMRLGENRPSELYVRQMDVHYVKYSGYREYREQYLMQRKQETLLTVGGLLTFLVMAIFGWVKLKYGFNMTDEGMYMADGWRLTVGDQLFPNNATNASTLYVMFNALIFTLHPDITLLEFRQLQYVLSLLAIIIFGTAIYRWSRKLWPIPLTMAVFAFTGLDAIGICSNMSYYTYPHLFIVLHIALLIFALTSRKVLTRSFMFTASGVALWGGGVSFLPLVVAMISPVLVWLGANYLNIKEAQFSFKELLLILSPGIILWGVFIAVYNTSFIHAIFDIYRYAKEGAWGERWVNYNALTYIAVTAVFWGFLIIAKRLPARAMIALVIAISGLMFGIVDSNLAGFVRPYWSGWFSNQLWFCSLLLTFMAIFLALVVQKKRSNSSIDGYDGLILIILTPSIVFALVFSHYSSLGILTTLYVAIPVTMALALFLVRHFERRYLASQYIAAVATLAVLFPFSYHLVWADWKFTKFDLTPEKLSHTVAGGFAGGIRTNMLYASMIRWMETTSSAYSAAGEFAIIMDRTSMGHMLIKRRPSLNHSWIGWGQSPSVRQDAMKEMFKENRQPKIAYRFLRLPLMLPISLRDGTYRPSPSISYAPDDPISAYVTTQMQHMDTFSADGEPLIELYVQR